MKAIIVLHKLKINEREVNSFYLFTLLGKQISDYPFQFRKKGFYDSQMNNSESLEQRDSELFKFYLQNGNKKLNSFHFDMLFM